LSISNYTDIRLRQFKFEDEYLSEFATKSSSSLGREHFEQPCPIRTEFQRDRDRILHSKAFRRLKHKTQVFFSPEGDHYRTRMTHALEVSQVSRTIARALKLNEDLTEAIALGHDLGHTPFGHSGEEVLDEILPEGFRHNEQSVRVVSLIEDLNLTKETIDGILNHTGKEIPYTLEGQIVKIADRVAYINHDIDDSIRAGIIAQNSLPDAPIKYFGQTHNQRITKMVTDIIENSCEKDKISMSSECWDMMNELRSWLFKNVYIDSLAKTEEGKAKKLLRELFDHYTGMLESYEDNVYSAEVIRRTVADYIAGMTDRYALQRYKELFIPKPMYYQTDNNYLIKLADRNNR
jgi:dGTPase